jgi:xanthine dehydrogenase YagS FAD-binding subunit
MADPLKGQTRRDFLETMGGVAPRPWRLRAAETALAGQRPTATLLREAVRRDFADARPLAHNRFKIELGIRTVVRAIELAGDL